jgi:hypothetical protein
MIYSAFHSINYNHIEIQNSILFQPDYADRYGIRQQG